VSTNKLIAHAIGNTTVRILSKYTNAAGIVHTQTISCLLYRKFLHFMHRLCVLDWTEEL